MQTPTPSSTSLTTKSNRLEVKSRPTGPNPDDVTFLTLLEVEGERPKLPALTFACAVFKKLGRTARPIAAQWIDSKGEANAK